MSLLLIKSKKKSTLSKAQQTFNRLIKKIEKLQQSLKETEEMMHEGLSYFHSTIVPLKKDLLKYLLEVIPVYYSYYKTPSSKLTKNEKVLLKNFIKHLLSCIYDNSDGPSEISPEIRSIINDIEGIDVDKELSEEFSRQIKKLERFGAEHGVDLDLSSLNEKDSMEEIQEKIAKMMFEKMKDVDPSAFREQKNNSSKSKPKTKKELEKELKERELAEMQKKGLSTIYKQLAKVFHPDLEQDSSLKLEKEILMKRLTVAYENQDLHTLLMLEIEWMNRSLQNDGKSKYLVDDQLSVYNKILKDQVDSLNSDIDNVFMHPRYYQLHMLLRESNEDSVFDALLEKKENLSKELNLLSKSSIDLQGKNAQKNLRQILKDFAKSHEEELFNQAMNEFFSSFN